MESFSVTYESIQGGQPRAYADSIYEGYLTFAVPEGQAWGCKFGEHLFNIKPYIQLMCHSFVEDTPTRKREWHEAWLDTAIQVSPGRWRVKVVSPYLD